MRPALEKESAAIDRAIERAKKRLGPMDDIRALIAAGDTAAAVRAYRARTGLVLADAKAALERGL